MNRLYVKKRNLRYFYYWLEHIYQDAKINIDCCEYTLRNHLDELKPKEILQLDKEIADSKLILKQYDELEALCNAVEKEVLCSPRAPYGLISGMKVESFERIRLEVFKKWAAIVMPSDVIYVHEIDNFKLGSLLKERRVELNHTSIEISSFIGISNNAFRNYEKGLRTIPLNVLYALCELYKLDIKEMLEKSFL